MALTPEILFVNPDYIKRITNINGSIEDAYLVPSIILAQDKYIQLYLGTDLLNKLKADIQAGRSPAITPSSWIPTSARLPFGGLWSK